MKRKIFLTSALIVIMMIGLMPDRAASQSLRPDETVSFAKRNLGGPRLGISIVTGNGDLWQRLEDEKMGRSVSQFGWHFEYQVIPEGGGPQFVVQLVPLIAGVEYGKLIPSGTLAMGVRFPSGIEFGLGPNILLIGKNDMGKSPAKTALVLGVGKSFNYGGVSIPLNLVYATNPDGNRISVIFGYAIAKAKQRSAIRYDL
ncbi:MAG: hypothetical protein JSW64_03485 [Candidatus Zixiibacteriota bacterium]|nr:MAG: hypothetical protein JSW64_03485 [candidate division Zixibacteria bacterium]